MREQVVVDRCPSLGDLVVAADGGFSPAERAAVMAHVRQCEACAERLRQANAFLEASAEFGDDASAASAALTATAVEAAASEAAVSEAAASGASASWTSATGASATGAGASVVSRRGNSERVENARAAMPVSYDEEIGAKYDSDAKTAARSREFARRLHKQKQDVIHRPAPATAWVRQWLPAAALIPLLILGLAWPRMQAVVRAEELLQLASNHESSLPADRVQRVRFSLTPGIAAFASAPGGSGAAAEANADRARGRGRAAAPRVTPFLAVRDVRGGAVREAWIDGAGTSGEFAALAEMLSRQGFEWRQPLSLAGVRAWRSSPGEKHDEVFVSGGMYVLRTTASEGPLRGVELTVRRHDFHVVKLAFAIEGMGRLEIAEIEESVQRAVKAAPVAPPAPIAGTPIGMTAATPPVTPGLVVDSAYSPVTTVVGRAPATQPGLSRWLERTFGARPERKTFVPDLQRLVIGVRQHLSTLDTLARRYPEEEVAQQWSGADRAALRRRVDESYRRISRDLNDLDARIGILFGSTTRPLPVAEAPADWRQRAAAALAHAEAMDGQVRQLLAADDVPSGEPRAAGGALVPSTFAALWDVVHAPAGGPASR